MSDEHVLVCISSSPSNVRTIRAAAELAGRFGGRFSALFIETPDYAVLRDSDRQRLTANMHLAEKLGAGTDTRYGDDIALRISEYARTNGVTRIVIGADALRGRKLLQRKSLADRLVSFLPDRNIYVIPDTQNGIRHMNFERSERNISSLRRDSLLTAGILFAATLLGFFFIRIGIHESNVITLYFLAVLIISVVTDRRVFGLVTSVASVILFNFLFVKPVFSMHAYDAGYFVTFGVMLISSIITSSLASRMKDYATQMSRRAYRTRILLDTNQMLLPSRSPEEILSVAGKQISKLLGRVTVIYPVTDGKLGMRTIFWPEETEPEKKTAAADGSSGESEEESSDHLDADALAVRWVMENRKRAGSGTRQFSDAEYQYLAIRSQNNLFAIVGIHAKNDPVSTFEYSICLSILGECALASENAKNAREKEQAAIAARNEQLRANLLRTISHDLRTPLTSISGNASNLIDNGDDFDKETRNRIYQDIRSDSLWLIATVENLLSITRLEGGNVKIARDIELMDEVIEEALRHLDPRKEEHRIIVKPAEEPLLVSMDARLMVQVLVNLVNNAIKYTQKGSVITIAAKKQGKEAVVSVSDDGPGMSDEVKQHAFDMFYTGSSRAADSSRSLGLGLALCRSIIEAHDGTISVYDCRPHGADFVFRLPAAEIHTQDMEEEKQR
jgi:two-component system sensor histidine kinase KdpD